VPTPRLCVTDAIVLSRFDYGEADRIMTLFTPAHGKLKAIAKGVRRTTSRLGGALEPLAELRVALARGRTFDVVTQVEVTHAWLNLRDSAGPLDGRPRSKRRRAGPATAAVACRTSRSRPGRGGSGTWRRDRTWARLDPRRAAGSPAPCRIRVRGCSGMIARADHSNRPSEAGRRRRRPAAIIRAWQMLHGRREYSCSTTL
jgi:hypothetical protein